MRYLLCLFYFIVLLTCLPVSRSWAQPATIIIDEEFENAPLSAVLDTLEKKYQLRIAFDQTAIQNIYINQQIKQLPLEETLALLFQDKSLDFQLVNQNQVFIRKALSDQYTKQELTDCSGKILDALTGAPLAFATIIFAPGKGASTDEAGVFSFQTKDTITRLAVQYLGYEPLEMHLEEQPTTDLTIRLTPKPTEIDAVTIVEKEPLLSSTSQDQYGGLKLNAKQLATLPSFVGGKDILRSVQLLPGVSAHDDLSSEIKVRGSNGEENMVVLDGIKLYNVSHFFGIFSIINPSIVDEVKLYKNVYPIEFGGRTASVVDITSLPMVNDHITGSAEINLLTSNAYLKLPLGSKMDLMVGGRITNKNVGNTRLFSPLNQDSRTPRREELDPNSRLFALDPNFRFYDANAKWQWLPSPKTKATLSFFSGSDAFDYNLSREFPNALQSRDDGIFSETANWKNLGASFQLEQQWSPKLQSKIVLSGSNHLSESQTKATVSRFLSLQEGRETVEVTNDAQNEIQGWDFLNKNVWQPNEQETFTFGAQLSNHLAASTIEADDTVVLATNRSANQLSLFAEYHRQFGQKLNLTLGLRPSYFSGTEKVYLSPRLYLAYPSGKASFIKASWSRYNQFLRQSYHENRLGRTFDIWVLADGRRFPVSNSQQFMLGWNLKKNGLELDVELYHKKIDGIIEHALIYNGPQEIDGMVSPDFEYRIFQGEGKSYGVDILLKKDVGNYSGWLAYTLSKTVQAFPQIAQGTYFPSPEDRRHQLKWINQYGHKRWDFSLTYIFASGAPYTDVSRLTGGPRDRRLTDPNDRISYLENYHRVDLGVNYRFPIFGVNGELGFSVFNLFDQKNIKYRQYNYAFPLQTNPNNPNLNLIGTEIQMLGITPNLSVKVKF